MGFINAARWCRPRLPLIELGDLNVNFDNFEPTHRNTAIASAMASLGVDDMLSHFRQQCDHWDRQTWSMVCNGIPITSRCDYILAEDRQVFSLMGIRSPRGYDSDHKVILGIIEAATVHEY